MSAVIYFVDQIRAHPGKGDELIEAFAPIAASCRKDPNCLYYEVYREEKDGDFFTLSESWTSMDAYDAHNKTLGADYKDAVARRNALLAKGIDINQTFKRVV